MDNLIRSFAAIVEDFKRKPYGIAGSILTQIFNAGTCAYYYFAKQN
jgi:hypothetical protein